MTLAQKLRRAVKKHETAQGRKKKEEEKYNLTRDTEHDAWFKMESIVADFVVNELLPNGVWLPCDSQGNVPSRSPDPQRRGDFAHYRRTVGKLADVIQLFEDANYHPNNIQIRIKLPEPPCGGASLYFRVDYDKMAKTFAYRITFNVWGGAKIAPALKHLGISVGDTAQLDRRLQRLRQLRTKVNEAIKATAKRLKTVEDTALTASSSKKRPKKK